MTGKLVLLAAALALAGAAAVAAAPARHGETRPCGIRSFAVAPGPLVSEATGQHTLPLRLRHRGGTCWLRGYPAIRVEDGRGTIPFAIRHGGDQMVTGRPPTRVLVRPGGSAYVVLNHYRCDAGDLRSGTTVRLGLPGASRAASVAVAVPPRRALEYCGKGDPGSVLSVTPFEPSLAAAFGR